MAPFLSNAARGVWRGVPVVRRLGRLALRLALVVGLAVSSVGPAAAQQEAPPDAPDPAAPGAAAVAVEETVKQIDALLAQLDTRIASAWAQAEEVLVLADAATDPDEQMRLEVLYGRMAALAQSFEEQRLQLQALRDELAASGEQVAP